MRGNNVRIVSSSDSACRVFRTLVRRAIYRCELIDLLLKLLSLLEVKFLYFIDSLVAIHATENWAVLIIIHLLFFLALFTILADLVQIAFLRVLSLDELSFLREEVLGSAVVDQANFLRRAEIGWQLFLFLFHFVSIVYRLATR